MSWDNKALWGSRRDLLKRAGTVGTIGIGASLAGCMGGDNGDTDSDNYPEQTVEWINPSGPSGGFGEASYALDEILPNHFPNSDGEIAVESIGNWPEGTQMIHNADPDGYTIGWGNAPGLIQDQVIGGLNYDMSEWTWFGRVQESLYSVYVTDDSPYDSIEDLQAEDEILIPQFGGTGELVNILTMSAIDDLEFDTVPGYEGGDGAYAGLLGGDIDVLCYAQDSTLPQAGVNDGEIRPIATLAPEPADHYEEAGHDDVPTMSELGYEDLEGVGLQRLVGGPPGIDSDLQEVISNSLMDALESDEFQEWSEDNDYPINPATADETAQIVDNAFGLIEENRDTLEEFYG